MRRPDHALDPEIAAELDAIDATLAGDPVDPGHAELAELALLLSADRPRPVAGFARELDRRAERRFAPGTDAPAPTSQPRRGRRLPIPPVLAGGAAGAAGLVAAVAVVVALSAGGGPGRPRPEFSAAPAAPQRQPSTPPRGASSAAAPAVTPPSNGRKVIQSSTLALGAAPDHIDDVAQQVLRVAGSVNGIVDRSTVTATGGPDGNALFELRIPSASLPRAMSELSQLPGARVLSRTDNSQDINDAFLSTQRRLADATALRDSLLKQLQNATTQQQIDSLNAQLGNAEGTIRAARGDLNRLSAQVNHSQVSVSIQADSSAAVSPGFTIGTAVHDALKVLTVTAGVALIVLAVAIPVGLLAALTWWIAATLRRRRREHALDLA